ncbi:DNA-processing protein DprA [Neptuniibacter sp. QD48_11]|uniref:DNA-processing protein DprA n=1 Tax=Neptuniibacter sp. QD48_11 TaxID=3398211 RepID=UPI0039F4E004
MVTKATYNLIALSRISGVGPKALLRFTNELELRTSNLKELLEQPVLKKITENNEIDELLSYADRQLDFSERFGHKVVSVLDDKYPGILRMMETPPPLLFYAGDLDILEKKTLAIIGTREPTEAGEIIGDRISSWFSSKGWVIVSGLAKGVDTIAHRACMKAGSKTVAVLAQGLNFDKVYPAENRDLCQRIVDEGGLVLSEYAYGVKALRGNFVARDRIQAALAYGVTLIQSDLKGGSIHASRAIIDFGRLLLVAGQSKNDIAEGQSKIAANQVLLGHDVEMKKKVLRLNSYPDNLVFKLFDRECLSEAETMLLDNFKELKNKQSREKTESLF